MVEFASEASYWTQLLAAERGGRPEAPTGNGDRRTRETDAGNDAVYRFCSWTCREVAYHSLPFEQRRHYHLLTAKWLEAAEERMRERASVTKAADPVPPGLKFWLYPMLAEHWMQLPGGGGSVHALKYLEEAARNCLETNMHHEVTLVTVIQSRQGSYFRGGSA